MGERERDEELEQNERESGQRIPGRDFGGASYASTEREQTRDHRGESEGNRLDDAENAGEEEPERPRDES